MKLMIRKPVLITPYIRLNIFNSGFSVSVGHARLGWLTLGKRGIRESFDTPIPGIYVVDSQPWDKLLRALRLRK